MYSYEERIKAVKLFIKYDNSIASVIRELGYPSRNMLLRWYAEYKENGKLHKSYKKAVRFTEKQKLYAVQYYIKHGKNASKTVKVLGYPSRQTLINWLDEAFPTRKKRCLSKNSMVECPQETKEQAVIDFCARQGTAQQIAETHNVSRVSLYKWKKQLLGEEQKASMQNKKCPSSITEEKLIKEINNLRTEEAELRTKLYRLRLEYDILEKASELLKKDVGINLETISNREKAELIDALREKYRLKDLLEILQISKSSYCYQENCIHGPDKYTNLRTEIQIIFHTSNCCYGYRRIHASLKKKGIMVSEKVVRRIMKEEELAVHCRKRKRYSSYAGEISPEVDNIINRDFHAETPNTKWLTDITEFSIPAGKVYLSPIIDCFDGLVVSWAIGTSPSADLANGMLDEAISSLKEYEHPVIHSDRGAHYRWPGWIQRTETAGLVRSMSKKGCSPDNSACEGFFGRLKNEMFYGRSWQETSTGDFITVLDDYIHWYNEYRIKESLGWMSPLEYRRNLGLDSCGFG